MIVNRHYLQTMHEPASPFFNVLDWPDPYDFVLLASGSENINYEQLADDFKKINERCLNAK